MKRVPHRDFYNVRKVDTHVHHSASMNQKHLLRFIKAKIKRFPDDVVIHRDGKALTLQQVFESLKLTAYDLSIDTLDMHAHQDAFHRFDKFNLKYNPMGESRLREIFLKTDNLIKGRYLAELTKEVMNDLEQSKYQMAEYRVSIYGRTRAEWDKLASWVVDNGLFSPNVRWLIQVPRLYDVYKANGTVDNFEQIIRNVFEPLFEVTQNRRAIPSCTSSSSASLASTWSTTRASPSDVCTRSSRAQAVGLQGQSAVQLLALLHVCQPLEPQPVAQAAGLQHVCAATARGRGWRHRPHGGCLPDVAVDLARHLTAQGTGSAVSVLPQADWTRHVAAQQQCAVPVVRAQPVPDVPQDGHERVDQHRRPLQFHLSKEPLLEEYSVATQIYKLTPADMCELARNSVLQSGWEMEIKRHWLGPTSSCRARAATWWPRATCPTSGCDSARRRCARNSIWCGRRSRRRPDETDGTVYTNAPSLVELEFFFLLLLTNDGPK